MQSSIESLITQFRALKIKKSTDTMELESLKAMVETLSEKLNTLTENLNAAQNASTMKEHEDIITVYPSGDSIQLDAFKVLPEFDGDKFQYRSWRHQVSKLMTAIESFKSHPKYATALAIVRAKIIKGPSNVLINNNTANNFDAIIDRLDLGFADQRPLYTNRKKNHYRISMIQSIRH